MDLNFAMLGAYFLGSAVTYLIMRKFHYEEQTDIIDMLVDRGFLKHKKDDDGNIIILKWYDNTK